MIRCGFLPLDCLISITTVIIPLPMVLSSPQPDITLLFTHLYSPVAGSKEDETGEVKQPESSWFIMTEHEDLEAAAAACAIVSQDRWAGTEKSE